MNIDQTKLPLPPEIIVHISNYLNIKDKLNLRLINKSFKFVFDNLIRLNRLTLIFDSKEFNKNWFYTNASNKEIDLIKLNNENILNDLLKNDLFLNVKKLFFQSSNGINLNESINQLKYLEELNINCRLKSNGRLSLSNLRILSIQQEKYLNYKIELETPSLSFLRCDNLNDYQFNYPDKIIYLDTELMVDKRIEDNEIEIFKNLEYLILDDQYSELTPILLTKLDQLKELHFNQLFTDERDLNKVKEFCKYKLRSKLNNLRIFLSGIDLKNLIGLNKSQLIRKYDNKQLDLILQNYSKTIDILPFIYEIDFDKLLKFLNSNQIVSLDNIINKFPNIKKIEAYRLIKDGYVINFKLAKKDDINCFFKFLSKCNNLNSLTLQLDLVLEEQIYYYKKLTKLCKNIEELDICSFDIDNYSDNYDFLYQFNNLSKLSLGDVRDENVLKDLSNRYQNIPIEFGYYLKYQSFRVVFQNDKYKYDDREFNSDNIYGYLFNSIYDRNNDFSECSSDGSTNSDGSTDSDD